MRQNSEEWLTNDFLFLAVSHFRGEWRMNSE
jgi:hypothetical protein